MRVLLVDDEALALDRLTSFFGDIEGVEVVGRATDGNMALEKIRELLPDLVIMDIQMPGRTGLRAAADIDVEPRPELVFVTAHEHYAPDAFEVDAADYLLKPIRFDRLRQAASAPWPGAMARIPPPTPLLPGRPTRKANSPLLS